MSEIESKKFRDGLTELLEGLNRIDWNRQFLEAKKGIGYSQEEQARFRLLIAQARVNALLADKERLEQISNQELVRLFDDLNIPEPDVSRFLQQIVEARTELILGDKERLARMHPAQIDELLGESGNTGRERIITQKQIVHLDSQISEPLKFGDGGRW